MTYRYQLQKYRGVLTRYDCPACGPHHRRTFVRFEDTRTGELLPSEFGRCNRQDQCGYWYSPYHKGPDGCSYAEAAQQGSPPRLFAAHRIRQPTKRRAPVVYTIPESLVQRSLTGYSTNSLARLLTRILGYTVAQNVLRRYEIGSSACWPGACVFWLRDRQGRVRGGQVVQFGKDGHTTKALRPDGTTRRRTTWAHTALQHTYTQRQEPLPEWLVNYAEKAEKAPCLFGEALLAHTPLSQPVAIVEAPKTAVLCAGYFPHLPFIWLAAMALSYLTPERLAPLKGRRITLFPDASVAGRAFNRWQAVAEKLRAAGFDITVSDYLECHATSAQQAAGVDLGDLVLDAWPGYPPSLDEKILLDNLVNS